MAKKLLKLQKINSTKFNPLVMAVFAAALAVAGYFIIFSHAAPVPPTIYLNPSSQTIGPNGTFTVDVRENSGTTTVNSAQANFSYPANLLTVTGIVNTGAGFVFPVSAGTLPYSTGTISQTGTTITGVGTTFSSLMNGKTITYSDGTTATLSYDPGPNHPTTLTSSVSKTVAAGSTYIISKGTVEIGGGLTGTTVTGDQLIARVTFQANTTGGAATMAFTNGTVLINPNGGSDSKTPTDILGSLTATGGGTYTVDANPPTVNVTSPANNAVVALGSTPTITATATDAESAVTKVEFYIDGVLPTGGTDTTSPYSFNWTTGVTAGAHTIQAKAYDTYNNVATSSLVNVTVADQTAPTVSITAPAANAVVSGTSTTVSANASDNVGVVGVQFKLDGVNLGTEDTTSPYSVTWNTTGASNATHTLTAVARDAATNATTSTAVSVNVDNAAPTVSITSPTNGSIVNGTVAVSAAATDNAGGSGISKVELYVDGTLSSTDTTPPSPYTFSWNTSALTLGTSHTLTAKAYDSAPTPNVTTSSAVTVTVQDTTPPTAPTGLHTTTTLPTGISLAWTASTDNVGVTGYKISRNGVLLTTTSSLTYTDSGLTPNTSYSYSIVATDAANNTSGAATLNASTTPLKTGDINRDNSVDLTDLSLLLSSFNSTSDTCLTNSAYTCGLIAPTGVDIFDLSDLLSNYGI